MDAVRGKCEQATERAGALIVEAKLLGRNRDTGANEAGERRVFIVSV